MMTNDDDTTKHIYIYSCRFLGLNFMVPNSWFSYQNVRTEEYEDEKSPLSMEGFGQAISLFLVSCLFY
jgi:hypothetical protein